jgi:hypothetical protein
MFRSLLFDHPQGAVFIAAGGIKHERRPPEDGQIVMTETCKVLIMCFKKHFKQF